MKWRIEIATSGGIFRETIDANRPSEALRAIEEKLDGPMHDYFIIGFKTEKEWSE